MSKKVNKKNTAADENILSGFDETVNKYFWLVIPILAFIYYISSRYSPGFYQDDEIAQYLNAVRFKIDPSVILGNNPKPGWKIFLVLPSFFGYQAVLIFNSLITAVCVYLTYYYIRISKLKFAFAGALLLASQPLFFDLSFRSYSEIFTALLLVAFLILYKKDMYILAGLLSGYIFTIRQEVAVFCAVIFAIFIMRKKFLPAIAIVIFPLLYNLLGYFKTGDLLFILSEMKAVASLIYNSQGALHYFKVYIFIVGPVTLTFFLTGFLGFIAEKNSYKEYLRKYLLEYVLFITVFAVQIYTMWNNGPNPGNWRYLLHISPIAAIFAVVGINNLYIKNHKKLFYWISAILLIFTLLFLSKSTDGFVLLETSDYTKVFFIIVLILTVIMTSGLGKASYLKKVALFTVFLSVIFVAVDFNPKNLSAENNTVRTSAEYIESSFIHSPEIYVNHSVFLFFLNNFSTAPEKYKSLNLRNLETAPVGALIIWENHYGYRPEWGADVSLDKLQNSDLFRQVNQFVSVDRKFALFVFEKIK